MTASTSNTAQAKSPEQLVGEADHLWLTRLVTEHAWRVDQCRADTMHELYVDDGVLDVGTSLRGRQAILESGRRLVEAPPWRSIRHVCGNMHFIADGANAAEGATILTVFMVAGPGPAITLPRSAWARITIGSRAPSTDGSWSRDAGSNCSAEATS